MATVILWCVLLIVFLTIEAETFQMLSIWFAIGSAVSAVLAVFDFELLTQFIVFVIVSGICFVLFRPLAVKLLKNRSLRTNADSLIGKIVLVTEDIDNIKGLGRGNINGVDWSLRSLSGEHVQAGRLVVIREIQGVKLIVEKTEGE